VTEILTILQARMSSSRLPGKVMRPLLGQPMMTRQIERLRRARRLQRLVVATSVNPEDDVVAETGAASGCEVYRGSLHDVLGRYQGALQALGPADHVVRVTADCPLTDRSVIDAVVELHLGSGADYTSNTVDRTYPKGLDVEIVKADLVHVAALEGQDAYEREHVTPFFYRRPERFRIRQLVQAVDDSELRWTVDTPADFTFTEHVYKALYPQKPTFEAADIMALGWTRRTDPDDPGAPGDPGDPRP
jgi:spore coat polysaccharide biosynthesis protein SpsF